MIWRLLFPCRAVHRFRCPGWHGSVCPLAGSQDPAVQHEGGGWRCERSVIRLALLLALIAFVPGCAAVRYVGHCINSSNCN